LPSGSASSRRLTRKSAARQRACGLPKLIVPGLADRRLRDAGLAAEVEDLLKWRESGLEVDAVDLKAVLTKPAVEGILRGGYAG
jgi:hypothetical protein